MWKSLSLLILAGLIAGSLPETALGAILAAQDEAGDSVIVITPLDKFTEIGGEYGKYTNGYGESNAQFLRMSLSKPYDYTWRVETGRVERFGDDGFGLGVSYTKYFNDGMSFLIGLSSGTGDYIFPEYRIDAALGRSFLQKDNLIATLGYTHEQSKGENRSDGVGLDLTWYLNDHWITGVFGRQVYGYPGSTTSTTGGAGLTYLIYRKFYLAGSVEYGDISYVLTGPGSALVDYKSTMYKLYSTYYITPSLGLNLRLDYENTTFWELRGISLSVFKEW